MESVFHDVSHAPGFKHYDQRELEGQLHSEVKVKRELKLADLSSVALRKLGAQCKQLIDTEKDQYPATRRWARPSTLSTQKSRGCPGSPGRTIRLAR